ncbi:DinB family protein [Candidatus Hodarchaeum mangrovi]
MQVKDVIKTFNYALENQIRFIIKDLSVEDFSWRPENSAPSIGWTIGHILVNHDFTINHRVCGNQIAFSNLIPVFGFNTEGDLPKDQTIDQLLEKLKILNVTITKVILLKENEWFEQIANTEGFPPNWQGKNIMKVFVLHFNHCFTHCGQILEIKRQLGKGAWGF